MIPSIPRNMQHMHGHGVATNQLQKTFKNPFCPPNMITPDTVLDYFCIPANHFYEVECNNQTIKMQNILTRSLEECLQTMTGIQYVVWSAQAPLYVIFTPLAYYYIINGVVSQAPDLYSFSQSWLLGAIDPLRKAFEETMLYSRYNVAKGYYWEFKDKPTTVSEKKSKPEKEKPQQARSSNFQNNRTDQLMKLLFEQFPPSSALEIVPKTEDVTQDDDLKMEVDEAKNASTSQQNRGNQMQPPANRQL